MKMRHSSSNEAEEAIERETTLVLALLTPMTSNSDPPISIMLKTPGPP